MSRFQQLTVWRGAEGRGGEGRVEGLTPDPVADTEPHSFRMHLSADRFDGLVQQQQQQRHGR